MSFLTKLFARDRHAPVEELDLIYIYMPANLMPIARGELFEDPIEDDLRRSGLGHVSGGGSSLSDPSPDGTRSVEFCGIDVDVATENLDIVRAMLRARLLALGCVVGTQLHYRVDGVPLQDECRGGDWVLDQPRVMMHPGFGV